MTIQIASYGAEVILKSLTGVSTTTETLKLKLYSNNFTPTNLSVLTDFTEVTGGGYTDKSLPSTAWTLTGNAINTTAQIFNFTSGIGNVYGYYLVGATSGKLIAAEKFTSGPYNIVGSGDSITVTATISVT